MMLMMTVVVMMAGLQQVVCNMLWIQRREATRVASREGVASRMLCGEKEMDVRNLS